METRLEAIRYFFKDISIKMEYFLTALFASVSTLNRCPFNACFIGPNT